MKASPFRVTDAFLKKANTSKEVLSQINQEGKDWWQNNLLVGQALSQWERNPADLKLADHIWQLHTESLQGKLPGSYEYSKVLRDLEHNQLLPALQNVVMTAWKNAFDEADGEIGKQILGGGGHLFAFIAEEKIRGWKQHLSCEITRARVTVDLGDRPSQWAKSLPKFIRALSSLPVEFRGQLEQVL
jgi:hypothetical protein